MPLERADDHPTFELGDTTITSYAAPSRGAEEGALFRAELRPQGRLPRHRHDQVEAFIVLAGHGTVHLDDEEMSADVGDSVVVPAGTWHFFAAGDAGAQLLATMPPGTRMIRDDGSETVPPWVG